jgi:hypothetical protein
MTAIQAVHLADTDSEIKFRLWIITFISLPFFNLIYWPLAYALFTICVIGAVLQQNPRDMNFDIRIPGLFLLQFGLLGVAFVVHGDNNSNVVNISAIIFVECVIMWLLTISWDSDRIVVFSRRLVGACFFVIIVGAAFSIVFASRLQVENPVADFLAGNRVRILAFETGHSVLIDAALICLIVAASNLARFGIGVRISIVVVSVLLISLAKTSLGTVAIATVALVFIAEWTLPAMLRVILYMVYLIGIVFYFFDPDIFDSLLLILRSNIQNADLSYYADGDLTAGRRVLNQVLLSMISEHPLFGVGHDHPILRYGIEYMATSNSSTSATTESGLRIAAKYGMPYFLCMLAILLLPLLVSYRCSDRSKRIFNVSLSLCTIYITAVNYQMEAPHATATFLYLSLIVLATDKSYLNAARDTAAPDTAMSRV